MEIDKYKPLFKIADVLQVDLFLSSDTEVKGARRHLIEVGPFQMDSVGETGSDFVQDDRAAVFCKIRKHLWLYVVCVDSRIWTCVFDGCKAGIKQMDIKKYVTGNLEHTLLKIEGFIVKTLEYIDNKWQETTLETMIGVSSAQVNHLDGSGEQQSLQLPWDGD